jgi:hypothetical protein
MMPLTLQTPPAFHVRPFDAEPSPVKRRRSASRLVVAILVAALLNLGLLQGARSARHSGGTGIVSSLGDWVTDLDKPEL